VEHTFWGRTRSWWSSWSAEQCWDDPPDARTVRAAHGRADRVRRDARLADKINTSVHFLPQLDVDKWLFHGTVPTVWLQAHLWRGHVSWYDFVFFGST